MAKNVHVVPHNGGWAVKNEGNSRATSVYPTKQPALDAGKVVAQKQHSELVIHGKDGVIQNKNSFGNDPCPPKDTKH